MNAARPRFVELFNGTDLRTSPLGRTQDVPCVA